MWPSADGIQQLDQYDSLYVRVCILYWEYQQTCVHDLDILLVSPGCSLYNLLRWVASDLAVNSMSENCLFCACRD